MHDPYPVLLILHLHYHRSQNQNQSEIFGSKELIQNLVGLFWWDRARTFATVFTKPLNFTHFPISSYWSGVVTFSMISGTSFAPTRFFYSLQYLKRV